MLRIQRIPYFEPLLGGPSHEVPLRPMIESGENGALWSAVLQGMLRVEPLLQLLSGMPPSSDVREVEICVLWRCKCAHIW